MSLNHGDVPIYYINHVSRGPASASLFTFFIGIGHHPDDPICVYIFRPNFASILKILHFYLTGMFWDLLTWTLDLYLTSSGTE
jgi:hypothetical protein